MFQILPVKQSLAIAHHVRRLTHHLIALLELAIAGHNSLGVIIKASNVLPWNGFDLARLGQILLLDRPLPVQSMQKSRLLIGVSRSQLRTPQATTSCMPRTRLQTGLLLRCVWCAMIVAETEKEAGKDVSAVPTYGLLDE
jgi:hypothetical protein